MAKYEFKLEINTEKLEGSMNKLKEKLQQAGVDTEKLAADAKEFSVKAGARAVDAALWTGDAVGKTEQVLKEAGEAMWEILTEGIEKAEWELDPEEPADADWTCEEQENENEPVITVDEEGIASFEQPHTEE